MTMRFTGKGVKSYRELQVWQKSINLVTVVYELTKSLPNDELYGLYSQMRRCTVSISSNIAEGFGRNSRIEFVRFIRIAIGSLYELQTQIEVGYKLKYFTRKQIHGLWRESSEIEKMLTVLAKKLSIE